MEDKKKLQKATFAAGCFWGVEEAFRNLKGVKETAAGYTGGNFDKPTYEDVCSGKTGHAEAVQIKFDPKEIPFEKLLQTFFSIHDPTTKNKQGLNLGAQYRSAIFFHGKEQEKTAKKTIQELEKSGKYRNKIVTEIMPAKTFYKAEEYHQKYLQKKGLKTC